MADATGSIEAPAKRVRPRQVEAAPAQAPAVVLTPEEAARKEWQEFQAKATEYAETQMEAPCPKCGARPGYNEVTGIRVRSYSGRTAIDGHRDSCPLNTVNKKK